MNLHYIVMQVLAVVKRWPGVRKISFVAHSLGGLVARYAIARLYEPFPKVASSGYSVNHSVQSLEQPYEEKISGLEPMNFITFATPHLGSRGHKQVYSACFCWFVDHFINLVELRDSWAGENFKICQEVN